MSDIIADAMLAEQREELTKKMVEAVTSVRALRENHDALLAALRNIDAHVHPNSTVATIERAAIAKAAGGGTP